VLQRLGFAPYQWGGVLLIVLYSIQAEIRFGAKARTAQAGADDRGSTRWLSLAAMVPVIGFVFAAQARMPALGPGFPPWMKEAGALPALPWSAWLGVVAGLLGLALRMWAVLRLRERYTRTLLVHDEHAIERGGPYRLVRHPGYLGSLLVLNGIALASGNAPVFIASLVATVAAYVYRVRVEDRMLVAAFGEPYERYRREVGGLLPRPTRREETPAAHV
jgi:protein-S-isoprenylcysteine O-methyltransferase